ncbi:Uncharacterized protein dnm_026950 [Desulfonema magnum]|uniref:Uncharacterized protein n=1 Tax=Desulfonema magnum TaxID=45655 RepID=A0A975BJP6_9BACT|nr:Uncharacterized protein dnm_026950 [Desulfonema magnum]
MILIKNINELLPLPDGVCNPVRNVCGRRSGKYSGRGCKPRPAKSELIKTVGCNLSLIHMGLVGLP